MALRKATKRQFDAALELLGATLDDRADNGCLNVDAPAGKVFKANGCHAIVEQFCNLGGQSWKPEAYYLVIERLAYGLDDCTDPECDVCHPIEGAA